MEFLRLVKFFGDAKVDERTHSFCWIHRLRLIGDIRGKYTVYRPHMIILGVKSFFGLVFFGEVWSTWGALEAPVDHVGGQVIKRPKVDQWSLDLRLVSTLLHVKVRSMLFLLATFEDEALIMAKSLPDQAEKEVAREGMNRSYCKI